MAEGETGQDPTSETGDKAPPPIVPEPGTTKTFTEEYVKGLRNESADYRTKLRTAEQTIQGFQKIQTEHMTLQQKVATYEAQLNSLKIEKTGIDIASTMGAHYPAAVLKLIDQTAFEYDDKGEVKNLRELLNKVKNAYPVMFKNPANVADGGSGSQQNNGGPSMNDFIRGQAGSRQRQ